MNPENTLLMARAAIWRTRDKEQLLFGQRPPKSKNYPEQWEFVGGKVDPDEDISLASVREAKEEANLSVIRNYYKQLPTFEYVMPEIPGLPPEKQSPYVGWLIKTWVTEAVAYQPEFLFETPPEHTKLEWLTLEEALERTVMPQTDFAFPYLRTQQNILRAFRGLDPLPSIKLG